MLRLLALMHVATLGAAYNLAGSAVPAAAARRALAPQMLQLTKPTNVSALCGLPQRLPQQRI